jgi:hypothetical protein
MYKLRTFLGALLLPLLLLAALLLFARPQPADAQSGVTNFTTVSASRDVYAGRDLYVDGFTTWTPQATATITNNGYLTPTASFVPLTAIAAVGTSGANIAVQPAGTQLLLLNVGSNTITFTETGTLVSAGNIALGANDSATLISDGASWYQISGSNN